MKVLIVALSIINILQGVTFTIFDIKNRFSVKLIKLTYLYNNVLLGIFKERMKSKGIIRSIKTALFHVALLLMLFRACFIVCFTYALVCLDIYFGGYYLLKSGVGCSNSQLKFIVVLAVMSFLLYGMWMAIYYSRKDKFHQVLEQKSDKS
jgi:hypothetical protein